MNSNNNDLNKIESQKKEEYSKDNLYEIISNLQIKIENIEKQNIEIKNSYSSQINKLNETVLNLQEKIDFLEKEISILKNKNLEEKYQFELNKETKKPLNIKDSIDNIFEVIENPWINEKNYYILYNRDYLAKLDNSFYMYPIKSKNKLEKNNIYKLIYNISYISGKFRVGFGELGINNKQLKEKGSIGLTNEGLYIEGEKISDIKIEKENKEIIFIINLKENQNFFEVFKDGESFGKYNFNLDNIYGLASMHNGSVEIKTLRNID